MKIAYSSPAKGEIYLAERNAASRIVRSLCPELALLAFQTRHGPKMSKDVPYLATFSSHYIRILSVRTEMITDDMQTQFVECVLPFICKKVIHYQEVSYYWPVVVVAIEQNLYEVVCSEGWLFPDRSEIERRIKKRDHLICSYSV
jgi:hypothetical protein